VLYIALGCAVLALLAWASKGRPILKRREWRLVSGALAVAAFAGAAYVGVRGEWGRGIVLVVLGLWLASTVRMTGFAPRRPAPTARQIGEAEARSILGVGVEATDQEIQAAYSRLMRMAHPDKGGTDGLAAQLNAARDRLLRK
jgi:hypothetical protein